MYFRQNCEVKGKQFHILPQFPGLLWHPTSHQPLAIKSPNMALQLSMFPQQQDNTAIMKEVFSALPY
jgi:hypothetical protein